MRKCIIAGIIALLAVDMTGCTPGNNVPGSTLVGATAGGLIGSAIFHNTVAGAIGGALIGGVIGDKIGEHMDATDRANMQNAVANVPVGQEAQWTNAKQNTTYTVRPVRNYTSTDHQYCREYQTTVTVNGSVQKAYGKACRQPDGSWKIVN